MTPYFLIWDLYKQRERNSDYNKGRNIFAQKKDQRTKACQIQLVCQIQVVSVYPELNLGPPPFFFGRWVGLVVWFWFFVLNTKLKNWKLKLPLRHKARAWFKHISTENLISKTSYLAWIALVMCRNSWEFYLFAGELLGNPLHLQSAVKQSQVGGLEKSLIK